MADTRLEVQLRRPLLAEEPLFRHRCLFRLSEQSRKGTYPAGK